MIMCQYCVAHKSYVGILVNLRAVVIVTVCCIRDSLCGPVVLRLVGILPLFCGRSQDFLVLCVHATGYRVSQLVTGSVHTQRTR